MAKREQVLSEEILSGIQAKFTPQSPTPIDLGMEENKSREIGETYSGSLDDAATLLLGILQQSVRDYAIELADITLKIPRWQLILGSLMSQYESGNLTAPSIDPSWRQVELLQKDSICEECKESFVPKRLRQKYCENKTPRCGDIVRKREFAAHKARLTTEARTF